MTDSSIIAPLVACAFEPTWQSEWSRRRIASAKSVTVAGIAGILVHRCANPEMRIRRGFDAFSLLRTPRGVWPLMLGLSRRGARASREPLGLPGVENAQDPFKQCCDRMLPTACHRISHCTTPVLDHRA
jgi:hypothetical protein